MNDALPRPIPVLDYLQRQIEGTLTADTVTHMRYPTAISKLLGLRVVDIGIAMAVLEIDADIALHGNQQGTIHGGLLCELADAAIGTAHSTVVAPEQSFTSIDLKAAFVRPVWNARLRAHAWAEHRGRTISHYRCEIRRDDDTLVATVSSAVMTLSGEQARGR
ncbi:PaaI family thioesterase [Pararobbsia silviterrae]|uniref:PaaI family thioesterase n=1 Tax=Pararobbsia silviterrae TaxID=1792498 RepID=A0A494X949_9BURK|nr:PaaI family thioesterase [Pararobbsia silviterrae]RKP46151.1 PaaI family thioesterase [Pararobbsia silviterrae]